MIQGRYTAKVPVTISHEDMERLRSETGARTIGRSFEAITRYLLSHPDVAAAIRAHDQTFQATVSRSMRTAKKVRGAA